MPDLVPLDQERPRLIFNRRAVAAGIAALLGVPSASAATLARLSNVPLTFDPADYIGQMRDGLFLPDYRFPMVRALYDDGTATNWQVYATNRSVQGTDGAYRWQKTTYGKSHAHPNATKLTAMELCCPDANGNPRYAQLAIG